MKIVMLGIIGAGKGTQSKMIARHCGIPHISTGDIFREAVKNEDDLGRKTREIMKSGGLVPDSIVIDIVRKRLQKPDAQKGYILDGFPRTTNQAVEFGKGESVSIVFYISLKEDEVLRRLKGRRICAACKAEQNIYLDKDARDTCRKCGGRLIQREDDTEETIRVRIKTYLEQTQPLIEYYREKGLLSEIDGSQDIDAVFADIKKHL
ncbi:MAG: adenylate kinase [Elusimicrobia bacterium]|nr:adenylate kinase [Elusimicrobiota bacterium]